MAINWDKVVRRDSGSLLFVGILFFVATVVTLFLYFTNEKIKSKNDITFINGPFEEYSWVSRGRRRGSSLTFKLQNYSNRFKIKADFFSLLRKDEFKKIPYGDTLTIGLPNRAMQYLNSSKQRFFVYSITSRDFLYLNLNDTILKDKSNSQLFLYSAGLFALLGGTFVYFGRKAKVKSAIW